MTGWNDFGTAFNLTQIILHFNKCISFLTKSHTIITTGEQKIYTNTTYTATLVLIICRILKVCFNTISIQADRFKNGPLFNPVFSLTHFFKHTVIFAHPLETVSRVTSVHEWVHVCLHVDGVFNFLSVCEAASMKGYNNYGPSALPW